MPPSLVLINVPFVLAFVVSSVTSYEFVDTAKPPFDTAFNCATFTASVSSVPAATLIIWRVSPVVELPTDTAPFLAFQVPTSLLISIALSDTSLFFASKRVLLFANCVLTVSNSVVLLAAVNSFCFSSRVLRSVSMTSASFCNALYSASFVSNCACKSVPNCKTSAAPFTTAVSDGSYPISSALRSLVALAPNATESLASATAVFPNATLLSPLACASYPTAVPNLPLLSAQEPWATEYPPIARELKPTAIECPPLAIASYPRAVAYPLFACANVPMAVAPTTFAFAAAPNATV